MTDWANDEDKWRSEHDPTYLGYRELHTAERDGDLRAALEDIRDLYLNDNIRPGTFAIRAGEIAVAALVAAPLVAPVDAERLAKAWHRAFHSHKETPEICTTDVEFSARIATEYNRAA